MKKKIAIYANGWNGDNISHYIEGLKEGLKDEAVDLHVFLGHDAFGHDEIDNRAECCIYDLPPLDTYDGAVFVSPGMDYNDINKTIISRCQKAGLPLVCVGARLEGAVSIYTDNYKGMLPLIDHLLEEHGVRDIFFIAGPKDNKDSNDRLQAVIDSCKSHGIPFGDDNILYANWDVYFATNYIREHFSHGEKLPDVIMCANDNTAFFISFILEDLGIKTPEDVYVTGFDGTNKAATFYPSLTSVAQPFGEMGLKTAECFKGIFAGKEIENEYYIPSVFKICESCGCDRRTESDIIRREICRNSPRNAVLGEFRAGRIHFMENAVLKSERYSTLGENLREFFYAKDGQEGNPFYIFTDPNLARLGECEPEDLPAFTLSQSCDMIVGKSGDTHFPRKRIKIKQSLIPDISDDITSHLYVFMPLHVDTFMCGFIVMSDSIDYFNDSKYATFKSAFNRILVTYIKNLKLTALNDKLSELVNKDSLTGVRNRVAYDSYKAALTDKINMGDKVGVAFAMFDLNDLKVVNDTYGHEMGDVYIRNSCNLICDIFKRSNIYRMGGDEFLAILQGKDYRNRDELLERFRKKVEELGLSDKAPEERISVASGLGVYDPLTDESIDSVIKRADEEMYRNKRKMKRGSDE